ncbi:MAG: RagB/SusD family nutrient uptake outer membrane protein [Bacteroidota bacterium]
MKVFKKILIWVVLLATFATSCEHEEFFELTNPPEFPWLNITEFERAAVSPYNYSFYSDWGGMFAMADRVVLDGMTDIIYHIPGSSANYPVVEVYSRQTNINIDRTDGCFNAGYRAIGIINAALDFYYENDEDPYPAATDFEKENNLKRIVGEMHFMRAFAYFHHTLRHCPAPGDPAFETEEILPLRQAFTDAEAAINADFVTTQAIYEFILEDLKTSVDLLPERYTEGVHHPSYQFGRITKFGARAFLARVLFRMGHWDEALEHINYVIDQNNGLFSLNQEPIEAFNRSDASRGNEVIWYALYYDEEKGASPNDFTLFTYLDYRAENGGHGENFRRSTWHTYSMANTMAIKLGWMDEELNETPEALRDKRYQQLYHRLEGNRGNVTDDPDVYEQQYTNVTEPRIWNDKYFRAPKGQFSNVPVIRLAEMYLTRSIIRFKNGDLNGAAEDLNMIRKRAWDEEVAGTSYEESDQYITSANITEETIELERLKELSFEGDRLYYLQALEMPLPPGERTSVNEVSFPHTGIYFPIPQKEDDFRLEE